MVQDDRGWSVGPRSTVEPADDALRMAIARRRPAEGRGQAALGIFERIECSCNRARIHSAIGWMSPADHGARMSEKAAEAA